MIDFIKLKKFDVNTSSNHIYETYINCADIEFDFNSDDRLKIFLEDITNFSSNGIIKYFYCIGAYHNKLIYHISTI